MQSRLTSSHYLSEQIFVKEQTQLFRRLWIYACMGSAVGVDQAFVTCEIGGISVLIQNHEGRLHAFENACPHRLMPLQTEGFGQAKMVCPYHGWVFDAEGKVKTIPKENTLYAYEAQERDRLCLRQFAVHQIGQLVFVNLAENPIDIHAQFSPDFIAKLEDVSGHFGTLSVHADIPTDYNWKLHYENVLDYNHVPYIHPKSLLPLLKADAFAGKASPEAVSTQANIRPNADLPAQSFHRTGYMHIEPWPWHEKVTRYGPEETFHNFFCFPNVNLTSVGGLGFLVQQFVPLEAGKTQVRYTLCLAREKGRLPGSPAILQEHLKSEVDVLMEDVAYLEALQKSLHLGSARVQHGHYESQLVAFADAYLQLMEASTC